MGPDGWLVAGRVRPTAVAAVVAGSAFPARLGARLAHTLPVATLRRLFAGGGRAHRLPGVGGFDPHASILVHPAPSSTGTNLK